MTKISQTQLKKIGKIPDSWSVVPLQDLVDESQLGTGDRGCDQEDSIPLLKMGNIQWGGLELNHVEQIGADKIPKHMLLKNGDLLFNNRNTPQLVGKAAVWHKEFPKATYDNNILRMRLKRDVMADFLCIQMTFGRGRSRLSSLAAGSTSVAAIYWKDVANYAVLLPPMVEQAQIVAILGKWDRAYNLTENVISAKQELRIGLAQRLLTGKKRFPKFVENNGFQKTRYGRIPKDWGYLYIGEIAQHISEKNKYNKDLAVLSCTKHQGLVDSLKYFGKQVYSENIETYKIVKRGQFAYATNHIEEGSIGYQDLYDQAVISPMYTVFEANERVNDRFLFLLFKTELYRHIFESMTSSSVNRRGSLRWNDFSTIRIPLPSIEEQARIVEAFQIVEHDINLMKEKSRLFLEQKKGLRQQLLTGKIRLKVSES